MALSLPFRVRSLCCSFAVLFSACVLAPAGLDEERARLEEAGSAFDAPYEDRALPDLPTQPAWRDVLQRALIVDGELEAAYFEWRAAVESVDAAAGWPNTSVMPTLSYLFSDESLKAWDRTTLNVGFDASENLELPVKTRKAGEVALAEARAARERFRAAKFTLQRRVLEAWLDLALAEEELRIAREDLELRRLLAQTTAARVQAGANQQELIRTDLELREAENELRSLEAGARATRALLNGMLARASDAPLELAPELPEPRELSTDDAAILAAGTEANPELAALAAEIAGREDALELARLQRLPNFNPFVGLTGSVSQVVGVAVMLPTTLPEIRSGIAQARAMLREAQAKLRKARLDRAARFVAALVVLRDSEREARFLEQSFLPAAGLLVESAHRTYTAGTSGLLELIEARRVLLDVRLMIAEARIERERRLAEIEELAGIDVETLASEPEEVLPHG